ncbi:kinesin heavy chain [Plasmopara halstedii]|uniref:Kinesin-like protein n=1 Tax=Plasmopara halstedii TaxID=4781 RepID=A0A0P1B654_PLAHL|nr:kinesin heavy chain [Plasmopara halstedii]CEG50308.1 kinesin heavy chain [Plasmopara halstedii]|eukprot:XP_024586677.1 kinesin heavy chain [Plasmopara halstedii]
MARPSSANVSNEMGNVRVCCRVRPQNAKELTMASAQRCVFTENETIEVKTCDGSPQKFTFDHVFGEECDQKTVFENVALPVVQDIMAGYNATIFAYGQTSSGKTYTMEGANIDDPELQGIIPRTATEIFNNVLNADENMEFIVKVSYIEIYMEHIRDLLDPYKSKVNLQVREDAQRGIFVEGMTEMCVTSDEELLATMRAGATNRAVAATGMNEGSSRSHSVFMVTLLQRHLENQATKTGKLYLVDLAGSEMVRKTGATGRQLEEAKTINKSLSALGMVINALTDSHITHVPYRDSKLTRILQESLGGNSRTNLIINVSPSSFNASETISTIRFGLRAKSIKNKAVVNEQRSVAEYEALLAAADKKIAKQQTYIIALEAQLAGKETLEETVSVAGVVGSKDLNGIAEVAKTENSSDTLDPLDVSLELSNNLTTESPPSPTARAGRALEEIQEKVTQLEDELAEEKQESMRRGEEIRLLTAKLEEHSQALETQHVLSEELQRVKELQEKTLEEKIRQRDALLAQLRTEFDRLNFDHKELIIHSETVRKEYDVLLQEMAAQTPPSGGELAAAAEKIVQIEQSTNDMNSVGDKTFVKQEEDLQLQQQELFNEVVKESVDIKSQDHSDLKVKYTALGIKLREYEKEFLAFKHATEHEKTRLQEDIDRKTAQIRDLEARAGRAGASTGEGGSTPSSPTNVSGMSARERQHMRSIQQKLEQLVAVHRQLLRKYASLDLELSEAKKKLVLRDERIKQVEANNRIMAGNMRAQAEKHVEELTHLRDQIADFRGAQRSHFEAQFNHTNAALVASMGSTDTGVIKTLRGGLNYGGDGVIRPIRGGGRRKTQLEEAAMTTASVSAVPANDSDAGVPTSGFLTRLFGKAN